MLYDLLNGWLNSAGFFNFSNGGFSEGNPSSSRPSNFMCIEIWTFWNFQSIMLYVDECIGSLVLINTTSVQIFSITLTRSDGFELNSSGGWGLTGSHVYMHIYIYTYTYIYIYHPEERSELLSARAYNFGRDGWDGWDADGWFRCWWCGGVAPWRREGGCHNKVVNKDEEVLQSPKGGFFPWVVKKKCVCFFLNLN